MAVGYKPDPAGPATTCPPPPTPPSTVVTTTTRRSVTTTTVAPTSTTTTLNCHDSYDAHCGEFRWDPSPDNQPLTVQVTVTSTKAKVGDPVTFHVVVDDPDRPIDRNCSGKDYGDNSEPFCGPPAVDCAPTGRQPHGPWSPPAKQPDHLETDVTHVYRAPGTYTVHFVYRSTQSCAETGNPYYSEGSATATVRVDG
jgi:hypothetical protein